MTWPRSDFATFDARPVSVSRARQFTLALLDSWSIQGEQRDNIELLVSEMFTNAVKAATSVVHPPTEPAVHLRLSADHISVLIEVADPCQDPPRVQTPGVMAQDGRGLILVSMLSKQWSYYFTSQGGKVVWAHVAV